MIGIRRWAILAAFLWLAIASEARKKLKRDELESLKSIETDIDEEFDEVNFINILMVGI